MYTTINLLKATSACVPGFTRVISFFGHSPKIKDQKISLATLALLGDKDDVSWAISSSVIIDPVEYEAFYKKHAVSVFRYRCHAELGSRFQPNFNSSSKFDGKKHLQEAALAAFEVMTIEQLTAFLEKYEWVNYDHDLWRDVIRNKCWHDPAAFMQYVFEIAATHVNNSTWAPTHVLDARKLEAEDDDDDSRKENPEDGEDSEEDENSDSWTDADEVRASAAPKAAKNHWLTSSRSEFSTEEHIAHAFSDDPYAFMVSSSFKTLKGVKLDAKTGTLSFNTADPKLMLNIIRTVTKRM